MALLLKNGAVFLHVPKTGGTWVKSVLQKLDLIEAPLGHGHSDFERAYWHDKLHHDLKVVRYIFRRAIRSPRTQARMAPGCFKFCFVREPLSWYESWWSFMQMPKMNWRKLGDECDPYKWEPFSMLNGLGSPDFNTFVHNVNRKRPGFVTELYGWYVRPGISFVGKQERIVEDLAKIFEIIEVNVSAEQLRQIPPTNESRKDIPALEWDPALKRETLRLEYGGYVRYGYAVPDFAVWAEGRKDGISEGGAI